jgi:Flp pilus assembly protein protease CpaA
MITDYLFAGIAVFGAVIGTATDLKGRWVPDWINYFMIAFGLIGHTIISLMASSIWPIISSLVIAGIFLCVGTLMVYGGLWGGGDAKMLVGFGALLPTTSIIETPWPFPLTLWFNILIFGIALGIFGTLILILKNKGAFLKELKTAVEKNKLILLISPAVLIIPAVSFYFNQGIVAIIGALLFLLIPLVFILKATEKACMFKFIMPSQLVEGDWLTDDINVADYVYKPARSGIEIKDIKELQKLEKQGKLKQVRVKEGLPYVPAFLAGLLFSLFFGDVVYSLIMAALI